MGAGQLLRWGLGREISNGSTQSTRAQVQSVFMSQNQTMPPQDGTDGDSALAFWGGCPQRWGLGGSGRHPLPFPHLVPILITCVGD